MQFHQHARDRQTQAEPAEAVTAVRPRMIALDESLEDAGQLLGLHAHAGIGDADQ